MLGNFVFDIDHTIAVPHSYDVETKIKEAEDRYGVEFFKKHCIYACGYPHFLYPGYYELFQWLHSKGGKLLIFSTGIKQRNIEFIQKFMKNAFGEKASDIECKIFSRDDCIDTTRHRAVLDDKMQSYFYGQLKKKLSGIIVPETEMSNTLLIDDDKSYMVKGEEYNFMYVLYNHNYVISDRGNGNGFYEFHQAYYLAGILSEIFKVKEEKKCSLVEATKFVQIDSTGSELNSSFRFPTTKDVNFILKGKEILKEFNPELKFHCGYNENGDY